MESVLRINELDNVAVAINPLFKGDVVTVAGTTYTLLTDVPAGHKMALRDIAKEEKVIKYGYPIGAAKEDIKAGSHVHAFNIHTLLSETASYSYDEENAKKFIEEAAERARKWEGKVPTIMAY